MSTLLGLCHLAFQFLILLNLLYIYIYLFLNIYVQTNLKQLTASAQKQDPNTQKNGDFNRKLREECFNG